ncbi:MAG: retropepsin-like domain-containing protein [Bacteroidetes bacterium]|nr:retropepsin-like domain-containing protein [Bacteroidota bacterium]
MARKKKYTIKLKILRIDKQGAQLAVTGKIKRKSVNLILDTGASQTVFDINRISAFIGHGEFEKVESLSSGLGTSTMESHLVYVPGFKIGDLEIANEKMVLLDLSHVNQSYEILKLKPVDGVIGGDLLKRYEAIIDDSKNTLVLKG